MTVADAITAPFWDGAHRRELLIQRCGSCGAHQFYPRPFCVACQSDGLTWVVACGYGTVYTQTTVRLKVTDREPPYVVGLVDLDEGPRLLTELIGSPCRIGDRVRLQWRERVDAPPLPVFEREEELSR